MQIILSVVVTLVIIFLVPVIVYGLFSKYLGVQEPENKRSFFTGVFIQKLGTSMGFVLLYFLGSSQIDRSWLIYSLVWFLMFVLSEVGQVHLSRYSKREMLAGILSELIYFPLAGWAVSLLYK
jgi:hypothetical protein